MVIAYINPGLADLDYQGDKVTAGGNWSRAESGGYLVFSAAMLASGTSTAVGSGTPGTMTDSGAAWTVNQWAGYRVTSGGKFLTIASNTATVLTGTGAWFGGAPGTGAYAISDMTSNAYATINGVTNNSWYGRTKDATNGGTFYRWEWVGKVTPFSTVTTTVQVEQRMVNVYTALGAATNCGFSARRTAAGTVTFRLRASSSDLGNITVTAGTEYVVHHVADNYAGYHMLEVFNASTFALVGQVSSSAVAPGTFGSFNGCRWGAENITQPTDGTIAHKFRDVYALWGIYQDSTSGNDFYPDWFGPDYATVKEQGYTDNTVTWNKAGTTPATTNAGGVGGTAEYGTAEWPPEGAIDNNDDNDGTANDKQDKFTVPDYTGAYASVVGVALWNLGGDLDAGVHYQFIDDGTTHHKAKMNYAGTGNNNVFDSRNGVAFSWAPDSTAWTTAKFNGITVGYERVGAGAASAVKQIATFAVLYIVANAYGASARTRRIGTDSS